MITKVENHQIFVFGSNLSGRHAGGAARQAKDSFGAIEGQGIGLQGQSYAIPTLGYNHEKLTLNQIAEELETFAAFAKMNPKKEFLLTPIGTGIAGFSLDEIKSILPKLPPNIIKVGDWD